MLAHKYPELLNGEDVTKEFRRNYEKIETVPRAVRKLVIYLLAVILIFLGPKRVLSRKVLWTAADIYQNLRFLRVKKGIIRIWFI